MKHIKEFIKELSWQWLITAAMAVLLSIPSLLVSEENRLAFYEIFVIAIVWRHTYTNSAKAWNAAEKLK